jgi:diguanylate cyclase (GGDEF)-like protein
MRRERLMASGTPPGTLCWPRSLDACAGCTRADALVARVGGAEFAILLDDPDSGSAVADRVLAALRAPVVIADSEIAVTASVGIAHATRDDTLERLLRHADTAMYAAKTSGKDNYAVFDEHGGRVADAQLATG